MLNYCGLCNLIVVLCLLVVIFRLLAASSSFGFLRRPAAPKILEIADYKTMVVTVVLTSSFELCANHVAKNRAVLDLHVLVQRTVEERTDVLLDDRIQSKSNRRIPVESSNPSIHTLEHMT